MDKRSHITTDHDTIMDWVEARGGFPASIKGALRIGFDDGSESLETIDWGEFFKEFEENGLAFLYQVENDDGEESHFHKFVSRAEFEKEIEETEDDEMADDDFGQDDDEDGLDFSADTDNDDEDAT